MAADEKWYFTREQLANTPSRRSGIDGDKELSYRQQAANFIQDMGQRLSVYPFQRPSDVCAPSLPRHYSVFLTPTPFAHFLALSSLISLVFIILIVILGTKHFYKISHSHRPSANCPFDSLPSIQTSTCPNKQ